MVAPEERHHVRARHRPDTSHADAENRQDDDGEDPDAELSNQRPSRRLPDGDPARQLAGQLRYVVTGPCPHRTRLPRCRARAPRSPEARGLSDDST